MVWWHCMNIQNYSTKVCLRDLLTYFMYYIAFLLYMALLKWIDVALCNKIISEWLHDQSSNVTLWNLVVITSAKDYVRTISFVGCFDDLWFFWEKRNLLLPSEKYIGDHNIPINENIGSPNLADAKAMKFKNGWKTMTSK